MIFSSYIFIFIFLPVVFFLYSICLAKNKITIGKIILIVSSCFFYAYGSGNFFPFFLISVFGNYAFGLYLSKNIHRSKRYRFSVLWFGILLNIILLSYYKYTDFIIFNLNFFIDNPLPYHNILLPIGISFFTFQLIAFLVDSYRGETKGYSLIDYLMFITFFPQLIVGPIVHHKDVVPQFKKIKQILPRYKNIARGLFLFAIGCAKKLLMADPLSNWAQSSFDIAQTLNTLESWVASLSYTLSYYFDLSGYADMAIGLGIMFGIKLPINFNSPYKARNFADYWRRWHITLSKFLGDYIFRTVYDKSKGDFNFYKALFITFLVSGFWHGAGWTFVLWGVINGIFVIFSHMMTKASLKLPFLLAWIMTFIGVVGTRVLFVSNNYADACYVLKQMFSFNNFENTTHVALIQPVYLAIGMILVLAFPNSSQILNNYKPTLKYAVITGLLFALSLLNMSNVNGFLYFQF